MLKIATPLSDSALKVMLLGGELGKEVVIALQRYGVETIVVDRYANTPAIQVAHSSHVINMTDPEVLRQLIFILFVHRLLCQKLKLLPQKCF